MPTVQSQNADKDLFVQFLNNRMLSNYSASRRATEAQVHGIQRKALALGLIMQRRRLLVPVIDLVESAYALKFLDVLLWLASRGACNFIGSAQDVDTFLKHKHRHFGKVRLFPQYFDCTIEQGLLKTVPFWRPRLVSTTNDLAIRWQGLFTLETNETDFRHRLLLSMLNAAGAGGESSLYTIPKRLDGSAFLWEIVQELNLTPEANEPSMTVSGKHLLGMTWLRSHMEEYGATILYNLGALGDLDNGAHLVWPDSCIDFDAALSMLDQFGLSRLIDSLPFDRLFQMRQEPAWEIFALNFMPFSPARLPYLELTIIRKNVMNSSPILVERALRRGMSSTQMYNNILDYVDYLANVSMSPPEKKSAITDGAGSPSNKQRDPARPRVFIIHGWAHSIRDRLELYMEKELGIEAIVMDAGAMGGRTLPEKFEAMAGRGDYAIALVTGDEKISREDGSIFYRIRPNILLEVGFFWGLLGRGKLAVFMEESKDIEVPTDLNGLGYQKISSDFDGLKYRVRKELEGAGVISET